MRFNAPPGWVIPAPDWVPDPGWAPDPSWPPAPAGWEFFVEEAEPAGPPSTPIPAGSGSAGGRPVVVIAAGAAVLVVLVGFLLVRFAGSKSDQHTSVADNQQSVSSTWTVEQSAEPGNAAVPQ